MKDYQEGAETVKRERNGLSGRWLTALLLFSLSLGSPAVAQEIQGTLTLDEALRLAKGNNPAFLQTANDEGPATWAFRESLGTFIPSLNANISGQYLAPGIPSSGIWTGADFTRLRELFHRRALVADTTEQVGRGVDDLPLSVGCFDVRLHC